MGKENEIIKVKKRNKLERREAIWFYLFISPWILGFIMFTGGPIIISLALGFSRYEILASPKLIGLGNYIEMFTDDPLFWQALKVTFIYSFGSIPLTLITALVVALLMNQKIRGVAWFRTIYYLPSIISGVAMSLLWIWIINPEFGIVNFVLGKIGIEGPRWLSRQWVVLTFIIMSLLGIGRNMVIYLAGLQGIPTSFYEAAEIDGANVWRRFWNITLPLMSPILLFTFIMGIILSFQIFTQVYIMTSGGPANASLFYVLYLYRNAFEYFRMGYASALAWVLFVIIFGFTLLVLKFSAVGVYYEGSRKRK